MSLPAAVAALAELRGLSFAEVLARFDAEVSEGVRYRGMDGLTALHNDERLPHAHFFFRGGQLQAIYIAAGLALAGVRPAELAAELGAPAAVLDGPAGRQRVYPAQGLAFAEDDGAVTALELFPPTTLEDYRARLWVEPGPRPIR